MAYRDSDDSAQARIAALELEVAELRQAKIELQVELQQAQSELAIERLKAEQRVELSGHELEVERRTLAQATESEIDVVRDRAQSDVRQARAEADLARSEADRLRSQLGSARARIAVLEQEIEALRPRTR